MKPGTNSKEHLPIIVKAKGKYCWGINGKKYVDFTGSNLTTILGYRPRLKTTPQFPGVSSAEEHLSRRLSKYTGTNLFRYYTNGSDAVNNAIRLARHLFGAEASVYYLGYAGSHDTYANTIKGYCNTGIPKTYSYQIDLEKIKRYYKNTKNIHITDADIAEKVAYFLRDDSIDILVFESRYAHIADKIKSKIRICDTLKDGIRALYQSKPQADFYCYGKSIFNGAPGAILTGKDEYMNRIDDVYYSGTFFSNNDMMREGIRTLNDFEKVKEKYARIYKYAKAVLPEWFSATPEQINYFAEHGILFNGYWQIMTPHTISDIERLKNILARCSGKG